MHQNHILMPITLSFKIIYDAKTMFQLSSSHLFYRLWSFNFFCPKIFQPPWNFKFFSPRFLAAPISPPSCHAARSFLRRAECCPPAHAHRIISHTRPYPFSLESPPHFRACLGPRLPTARCGTCITARGPRCRKRRSQFICAVPMPCAGKKIIAPWERLA